MAGTIWDSANKSASITLGRSGLVAVVSAAASTWKSLRATGSQSSGKWYIEFNTGSPQGNGTIVGFSNSSLNTASYVGSDGNSFGVQNQGSQYGLTGGTWQGWTRMGTIIQVAIDITNKLVWFRTDRNSNWNNDVIGNQNPATGTGGKSFTTTGALFPAWAGFGAGGLGDRNAMGINAGAFTFSGTIPTGFSAWDTGTPTLTTTIGGVSPSTWDSGNKHANVTLTGSNLTATVSTGVNWAPVRSTTFRTNGLYYLEATLNSIDVSNGWIGGVVESSWPTTTIGKYPGVDQFSYGYQTGNSPDWYYGGNSGQMSTGPSNTTLGHVYGYAIDLNRGLIWVKDLTAGGNWNNDAAADPVAGTRGSFAGTDFVYFGWSGFGNPSDGITINFGASTFTGTPPTGYVAWNTADPVSTIPMGFRRNRPMWKRDIFRWHWFPGKVTGSETMPGPAAPVAGGPAPKQHPWRWRGVAPNAPLAQRKWFPRVPKSRSRPGISPSLPPQPQLPKRQSRPWRRIWGAAPNAPLAQRKWFPRQQRRVRFMPIYPPQIGKPKRSSRPWRRLFGAAPNAPRNQRTWFPRQQRKTQYVIGDPPPPQPQKPKRFSRPWRRVWGTAPNAPWKQRAWFPPQQRRRYRLAVGDPPPVIPPKPKRMSRPYKHALGTAPDAPLIQRKWFPRQRKRPAKGTPPPLIAPKPFRRTRYWHQMRKRVKWFPRRLKRPVVGIQTTATFLGPGGVST